LSASEFFASFAHSIIFIVLDPQGHYNQTASFHRDVYFEYIIFRHLTRVRLERDNNSLDRSLQPPTRLPHWPPTGHRPSSTSFLHRESKPGTYLPLRWRIQWMTGGSRCRRWSQYHDLPRPRLRILPFITVLRCRSFLAFQLLHLSRLRTILHN
jgi:hypothetical protein